MPEYLPQPQICRNVIKGLLITIKKNNTRGAFFQEGTLETFKVIIWQTGQ
jgi:hypothetical protein